MKPLYKVGYICGWFVIVCIITIIAMVLWNCLMPVIFGLPSINFWESLGLLIMVPLIINGIKIKIELPKIKEK